MAGYFLSVAEQDALYHVPWLPRLLYMMAIRPRMDKYTGLVGVRPKICWPALAEWVEYEGAPGCKAEKTSVQQVRRAVSSHLVPSGLVVMKSKGKTLILELPKAVLGNSVQNKADKLADKLGDKLADNVDNSEPLDLHGLQASGEGKADADGGAKSDGKADTHQYCTDLNCSIHGYAQAHDDDCLVVDNWTEFWVHEYGYARSDVMTPACQALFEAWERQKRTAGLVRQCVGIGRARNGNEMPDNPVFFRPFLDELIKQRNYNFQQPVADDLSQLRVWDVAGLALVVALTADTAEKLIVERMQLDPLALTEVTALEPDDILTIYPGGKRRELTAAEAARKLADRHPFVLIAYEPEPEPEAVELKGGKLSKVAAMWGTNPQFLAWCDHAHNAAPGTTTADDVRQLVLDHCRVESRKELDHNEEAAHRFHDLRRAFAESQQISY